MLRISDSLEVRELEGKNVSGILAFLPWLNVGLKSEVVLNLWELRVLFLNPRIQLLGPETPCSLVSANQTISHVISLNIRTIRPSVLSWRPRHTRIL